VIIDATIEVINRVSMVQNYTSSIALKRQQLQALEASVAIATKLYLRVRLGEPVTVTYLDVLFAQRDLFDARMVLIDTKRQQLSAIVNVYQALGGGSAVLCPPPDLPVGVGGPPRMPEAPQMQPQPEPDQLPPPRPVPEGRKPPELKPAAVVMPMPPRGADRMRPEEGVPPAEVK
jgi:hypothetical protein